MKLSRWIAANGLTQSQVANQLGTSQSYVSALILGKRWPNRDIAQRILKLTNEQVTPNDFLPHKFVK